MIATCIEERAITALQRRDGVAFRLTARQLVKEPSPGESAQRAGFLDCPLASSKRDSTRSISGILRTPDIQTLVPWAFQAYFSVCFG